MADAVVELRWLEQGLRFEGGAEGGPRTRVDGDGAWGPSPMQTLLLGLAGCTAADIVDILGKMRVPISELEVRVEGDRAPEPPRRYVRIRLSYRTKGVGAEAEDKLRRAVALSHEKYCSVLHTFRPDVEVVTDIARD